MHVEQQPIHCCGKCIHARRNSYRVPFVRFQKANGRGGKKGHGHEEHAVFSGHCLSNGWESGNDAANEHECDKGEPYKNEERIKKVEGTDAGFHAGKSRKRFATTPLFYKKKLNGENKYAKRSGSLFVVLFERRSAF